MYHSADWLSRVVLPSTQKTMTLSVTSSTSVTRKLSKPIAGNQGNSTPTQTRLFPSLHPCHRLEQFHMVVYFFANSASMTFSTSGSSGVVRGANRATTSPFRPTMNFSKFQLIGPGPAGFVSSAVSSL